MAVMSNRKLIRLSSAKVYGPTRNYFLYALKQKHCIYEKVINVKKS